MCGIIHTNKKGGFDMAGLINSLFQSFMSSAGIGKASLREAVKKAPNTMGCYQIHYHGLKYVGKAEDGLRKRFVQYYNGTTAHYPSAKKIYEHRDEINVMWVELGSREACRQMERKWIEQYDPEWNSQSGWSGY